MDEKIARNMQITYRKRIGLSKIGFRQGQLLCFRCHEYESKILKGKTIDHKGKSPFKQTPALFPRLLRREFTPLPRPATVDSDVSSSSEKLTPLKAAKENRHVQQSVNRKSAKDILNEIFQIVGIPPLADMRNTEVVLRSTNDAIIHLRKLVDNALPTLTSSTSLSSQNLTLTKIDELIAGFKDLYIHSEYLDQVRLLTISPEKWCRVKIEEFFGCTERQARQALELRATKGILAMPDCYRGNEPLQQTVIDKVIEFYLDDNISRQSPNKKDVIRVNKKPVALKFLQMSISEAFEKFKNDFSEYKIGHSKFYELRPKWVKKTYPHDICMCLYHENFNLLLQDDQATWKVWKRVDKKVDLQRITGNIQSLFDELDNQWPVFLKILVSKPTGLSPRHLTGRVPDGKGADGIGATIKSSATKHLLRHGPEKSFRDAEQFYEFSLKHSDRMGLVRPSGGEPHRPIEIKYLSSGTIKLSIRWNRLPNTGPIIGIRGFHDFRPLYAGKINRKSTSTSKISSTFDFTPKHLIKSSVIQIHSMNSLQISVFVVIAHDEKFHLAEVLSITKLHSTIDVKCYQSPLSKLHFTLCKNLPKLT
ncbi:unnamed protein product, partial [Didymodactylos carnosus]